MDEAATHVHVLGLDLAGPANAADTAAALYRVESGKPILVETATGLDDPAVAALLPPGPGLVVGLDAPLSYQPGGGDRAGDRELRRLLKERGLAPGTVMAPTLTRMAYLTLRGMAIARLIEKLKPEARIVEVHPAGALVLREAAPLDVRELKRSAEARMRLVARLAEAGLGPGLPADAGDHLVAAAAAALAAWDWSRGEARWQWQAEPPHHPYDYTC